MENLCIGTKILELRVEAELTQKQLGQKLNMSQKTISSIEIGRTSISIPDLEKVAKIFSVPITYFFSTSNQYDTFLGNLSEDEISLIKSYRLLSNRKKNAIAIILEK